MESAQDSRKASYAEYRRETEATVLPRALKRAALVLFVINTVFICADWLIFPDQMMRFLPVRIGMDLVVAFIYFVTAERLPVPSSYATVAAGGWMLFTVVQGTGGPASSYYVGIVLLATGTGVLAPVSAKQGAVMIGSLLVGYVVLSLNDLEAIETVQFTMNVFFLSGASLVGMMSCVYLDRMRFADFLQKRQLQNARDELAQLDAAKSRFTANIHHELRTPLTLTLAPVEAMLGGEFGELNPTQRSYLETVQGNALRLLKLINNLLDLAKIESGQLHIHRRPLEVARVVRQIVGGATPLAERKGVALRAEGLDGLPVIHADPDACEKVIVNLLGNALKFTGRGGWITVRATVEGDGGVHLVVADSGVGIPPEQLSRIFDRFAQVDGSNTRKHEGTGIGLSLVKELVELHGGRIWAESEGEGRGTRMHVVLPFGESDEDETDAAAEAVLEESGGEERVSGGTQHALGGIGAEIREEEAEEAYRGRLQLVEMQRNVERSEGESERGVRPDLPAHEPGTPEVLIVEDNVDMRRLLYHIVSQEFRVRVARNGREGLEAVRERLPDLVLTDVMMPEMSGTELCAAIKAEPSLAVVPVVLVTSKAERDMKIEGLERGADDYVTKPFHPRELMARVRSLVRLRQVQLELAARNELLEGTNEELRQTMDELKEAGAQLVHAERLAAVGELAAGVAHEINNPVNFAMNAARTLRAAVDDVRSVAARIAEIGAAGADRDLAAEIRELEALRERLGFDESAAALGELTDIVVEGLERTSGLVGDLRDFAAPGGREQGEVDVAKGLRTTLRLVGHSLAAAGVELDSDIPAGLPRVRGDARALNQVFLNLLKNAAESFESREGRVRVSAREEGSRLAVEIRDDGPGMADEVRGQLFEPFFTTKTGRGTGLGLSISRRIVSAHGGTLEIESSPGSGTCVRISLPTAVERGGDAS